MEYILISLIRILQLIVLAASYNLVLGYTGMIHVGHTAFAAIGAYTSALLTLAGYPFWIGLIAGVCAAAITGLILGLPTVRLKEDYLVAATLGIGEIVRLIITNEREITGGSTGLPKIARPELFGIQFQDTRLLLFFMTALTAVSLFCIWKITATPFGKTLEAIREDEIAAKSLGKNTTLKKLQILSLGAFFAGLSGIMFAHSVQFIDPDVFNLQMMIYVFLIVVFGGSGTFWGPVVGATGLYILFEIMRFVPLPPHVLGPLRWMIFSGILITMIILKPGGLVGAKALRKKL